MTAAALDGVYQLNFVSATSFDVIDPTNSIVGRGLVGTVYAGSLKFTVSAGANPFAAGDRFLLTVLKPNGAADTWAPLTVGAVASGILFTHVGAAAAPGTVQAVAHVRQCELRASSVIWPAGFTPAQIAEGTNQLARRGIILRSA